MHFTFFNAHYPFVYTDVALIILAGVARDITLFAKLVACDVLRIDLLYLNHVDTSEFIFICFERVVFKQVVFKQEVLNDIEFTVQFCPCMYRFVFGINEDTLLC